MNNDGKQQDGFQTPTGVSIGQGQNQSGYNDTYYEQSYSNNKYNEYEEPKKSFPWKIVIIVVLALLFIFLFWYFLLGGGGGNSGNSQYEKLTADLCEKALEYERNNEGTIDRKTPGATAYIKIQDLVDNYLWDSKPIKDPRYKGSLFSKSEYKEYISFDSYLRLSVASNGEPYCEGFVDTSDDRNKPILSLKGTTPLTIAKGTNFEDPGARATDDVDGDITDKIVRSGTVDISTVGEYVITYTVSDTSGNTSTVTRTVIVEEYVDLEVTLGSHFDTITPVIELKGKNPYCMEFGTNYREPGATATDNVDGNITDRIVVDSSRVTGNRLGNFRVTYTVSDTFGHKAIAYRSVMVKERCPEDDLVVAPVNSKPEINVIGKSTIVIPLGENYKDLGATAWDKEDGDITHLVRTTNKVNTKIAQVYTVTYTVTDSGGLRATAKRTVTVKDPNANSNVATFVGGCPSNIRIPLGTEQGVPAPKAVDSNGNSVPVRTVLKDSSGAVVVSGKINYYRINVYTTEYYAKPKNGVEQQCSRTVTIYDDVKPTIIAPSPMFLPVRKNNCDITNQDMLSAGLEVSDAPNEDKPIVTLAGGKNKMCKVDTTGFDITVTATDASGNKTTKKIRAYVVDGEGGDATGVIIGNCGTNKETLMYVGDKLSLTSHVFPINATDPSVTWSSVLPQYATVSQNGVVNAIAVGSTDVVVTTKVGGHKATCKIVVKDRTQIVPVTGVNITGCDGGTLNLKTGNSRTLTATVTPKDASNKEVDWVSSKPAVATVTPAGVVKAIAAGESIVKVTTKDGNKSKNCKIVVTETQPGEDITAPTDIEVYANNANTEDPYNASGKWAGGSDARELKISVKAVELESQVSKFEMYNSKGEKIAEVGAAVNKCDSDTDYESHTRCLDEADGTYHGFFVIKEDINDTVTFVAINSQNLKSEQTKAVKAKLDNTGPKTTFKTWIEDPDKWVSQSSLKITYESDDENGSGVDRYEYTHDDVKAKEASEIKIEGSTNDVEMEFEESNLNKYVYVRAVDKLGNAGTWTAKPSYLNMDTVAPEKPGLSVSGSGTKEVRVTFTFKDNDSPKMSGFGKYEYELNGKLITKQEESTPEVFKTAGSYTIEAWSYDKAGNKSSESTSKWFKVTTSGGSNGGGSGETKPSVSVSCPTVEVGKTGEVTVTATGFKKITYVGYSIDDHTIATITKPEGVALKATVTGVKAYPKNTTQVTVTVKGTTKNGGTEEFSKWATCNVTVKDPPCLYRYYLEDRYTGNKKYSEYKYEKPTLAIDACKEEDFYKNTKKVESGSCKAVQSATTDKYAYEYTDIFTKKKEMSEYLYKDSSSAIDACKTAKISEVSIITCHFDPKCQK